MRIRRWFCALLVLLVAGIAFAAAPQVNSTSPMSGPAGTQVYINGSGFGATQGNSTISFHGATASVVSWSDTQIVAAVPATATTGYVLVTVGGVASNASVFFNVPPPQITSISPTSGVIGTQVTVNGTGFQATKGANSSISFNGINATTVVSWSDTQVVAVVPTNAVTGAVKVAVNDISSNLDQLFTLPNPLISSITPSSGPVGTAVQINGRGFGASQGTGSLQFNGWGGNVNATVTSWTDTSVSATVPTTATSGNVLITVGGVTTASNVQFRVPAPQVNSVTPNAGVSGTQITITGSGFQSTKGSSSLTLNGFPVATTSWNDAQIIATVPSGATTGPIMAVVNGVSSNLDVLFTIPNPIVNSISPSSGPTGTQVTVNGSGFGATQGTSTQKFSGLAASITSWSDTQIVTTVPAAAITGTISVTVAGVNSPSNVFYTVPAAAALVRAQAR